MSRISPYDLGAVDLEDRPRITRTWPALVVACGVLAAMAAVGVEFASADTGVEPQADASVTGPEPGEAPATGGAPGPSGGLTWPDTPTGDPGTRPGREGQPRVPDPFTTSYEDIAAIMGITETTPPDACEVAGQMGLPIPCTPGRGSTLVLTSPPPRPDSPPPGMPGPPDQPAEPSPDKLKLGWHRYTQYISQYGCGPPGWLVEPGVHDGDCDVVTVDQPIG
jgi:hypothetical protein